MLKQIIHDLSDSSLKLTSALLRIKVIASRMKNNELLEVVSQELEGYADVKKLPDYRKAKASSFATIYRLGSAFPNQGIPLTIFPEEFHEIFTKFPLTNGVESIENIANDKENDTLVRRVGADFDAFISLEAQNNGQQIRFENTRTLVHKSEVIAVLAKIRNKFLDLALRLEEEFPDFDNSVSKPLDAKNPISEKTTQIMNEIKITSTGDGNVINTGNSAEINASINIQKGDKDALRETFREIDASEQDITDLIEIIDSDTHDLEEKKLGPKTQGWIQRMVGKVLDGTLKVSLGTVAGVSARAIASYLGMH